MESIAGWLIGMKPWQVELGYGSFLTFEFGRPVEVEEGYTRGEWHLWVYMCAWRLETSTDIVLACEDSREVIAQEIKCLEGKVLRQFKIHPPALETDLLFEPDYRLRLFPMYTRDEDADHWMLFTPEKKVLTIGPGNTWSYEASGAE